uniref:DNA polymerase n=1 Tax=Mastomys natalensis cytomegalovirus 2 TaxID=2973540 RepID=A0A9Y1N883_9BETA|nr:DNA polymerase catalytic subunit [Mastomys natalensis cytomegalovirus 2]WEG69199.1 DNA polymerase catalytic subunit [Mastomys natalensis cytomegalovirus 2]WEG69338.1 DNA polymerase catalytic subunit [Mastomys natalensis cytomegalovirus 2]WEG69476.1 DNA polymerase catalytic subunit [Mastomys natalensis cytomegalovirus 2]WEG69614.1 DNA polymerase catalytic subunit [Mastomys natalensis cytomegalovirus 2]
MESDTFFNPYLRREPRREWKRNDANKNFLQIVPRGVLYDGASGLIRHQCELEPRMFFEEREYLLDRDMAWPGIAMDKDTIVSSEIIFHTYDQIVSLVFADSGEQVPPRWRHHIVPSANVIRMFGATECGTPICVNVFGQKAYFYCETDGIENLCDVVHDMAERVPEPRTPFTVSISPAHKTSMYGYGIGCVKNLYRISFNNWSMCRKIGRFMMEYGRKVYEINVDPLTRFLIDKKIPSFGWCRVKRYCRRVIGKSSTACIEIDCETSDLVAVNEETSWPAYRCMSFDIECMSETGSFPVSDNVGDIVIQISCICYNVTDKKTKWKVPEKHLFTIGPCSDIEGVRIYTFPSEYEMLLGFFIFVFIYSPEFITGYNINGFDIQYLLGRMEKLYKIDVGQFTKLRKGGRFFAYTPEKVKGTFGVTGTVKVFCTGMVVLDMYPVCTVKATAPNYKLDTMSELYLGKKKEDLSYKEIPKQFVAGDDGRARVGKYCVQDAALVKDLFNIIAFHYEAAAIARLARIPMRKVIFDGQQIRVYTCLLEECSARGMILPNIPHTNGKESSEEDSVEEDAGTSSSNVGYQGATVLDPECGFHHVPVMVFDFASLYPSIIMSNNLCYSTLLVDGSPHMSDEDVLDVVIADGQHHRFVKEHVQGSVLAELLVRWLSQRKLVKEAMKTCEDETQRMFMDKQQLALKVTCNAVYGFTGVAAGMLPCFPIASSITKIGREMLLSTARYIEENCNNREFLERVIGIESEAIDSENLRVKIIYGDTDSVFSAFYGINREALLQRAGNLAANITDALFKEPVRLEFEKMFTSLMMICKKRYIGKIYGTEKLYLKGVDLVRRTACSFVKTVVKDILNMVFNDERVSGGAMKLSAMSFEDLKREGVPDEFGPVINRLCSARDALYTDSVPVTDLILSSVLSQHMSEYKQKNLPHLAVMRRLAARHEELPSVGDRVEYVLTAPDGCKKNVPNYEIAEDPKYVSEANLTINAGKYFEQVVKAVTNTLLPVFPKDMPRREKFFAQVMPMRIYMPDVFLKMCSTQQL